MKHLGDTVATTLSYVVPTTVTPTNVNDAARALKKTLNETWICVKDERKLVDDEDRLAEIAATIASLEGLNEKWRAANQSTSAKAANELFKAVGMELDELIAKYEQQLTAFVHKMNAVKQDPAPQPTPADTRKMEQPPADKPTVGERIRTTGSRVKNSIVNGRGNGNTSNENH